MRRKHASLGTAPCYVVVDTRLGILMPRPLGLFGSFGPLGPLALEGPFLGALPAQLRGRCDHANGVEVRGRLLDVATSTCTRCRVRPCTPARRLRTPRRLRWQRRSPA